MLNKSCWVLENRERRLRTASPIRIIMHSRNISILSAFTTRTPLPSISKWPESPNSNLGNKHPLLRRGKGNNSRATRTSLQRQLSVRALGRRELHCRNQLIGNGRYSPSMSVATASSMASTPAGDRSSLLWQNFLSTQPVRIGAMIAVMMTAVAIWAYAVGASSA